MRAIVQRTTLALVLAAAACAASTAAAQLPHPPAESFGYCAELSVRFNWNYDGYHVIRASGPGAQIGLEPGDVIVAINGRRLNSNGAHYSAFGRSYNEYRGWASLWIRDVRTGRHVHRWARINRIAYAPNSSR